MGIRAVFQRRAKPGPDGPAHTMHHVSSTRQPVAISGSPISPSPVRYGAFYNEGKEYTFPRHDVNFYTNIRGIHSVGRTFFLESIPDIQHYATVSTPRGRMRAALSARNVHTPPPSTIGDLRTMMGDSAIGIDALGG
jgi:hypothetical protein